MNCHVNEMLHKLTSKDLWINSGCNKQHHKSMSYRRQIFCQRMFFFFVVLIGLQLHTSLDFLTCLPRAASQPITVFCIQNMVWRSIIIFYQFIFVYIYIYLYIFTHLHIPKCIYNVVQTKLNTDWRYDFICYSLAHIAKFGVFCIVAILPYLLLPFYDGGSHYNRIIYAP